ncbi:MAG: ABC transporter permease [Bryobacteraceae bacterium]
MRWRRYFERGKRDGDLGREIEHYVAQEMDDNIARGMSQEEARLAALRKFGNRTLPRETVYRMNTINYLDVLAQDLKYGLRQLRLRPGFALAAIVSLALGIGANTAIFTLVDQILLRLLPVENPHELVQLRMDGVRPGGNWGDGIHTFPYPTYVALRDQNTVFSGLTGQRVESASLMGDGRSELITVAMVAGNYFQVLGVRPHLGRSLTPDDDRNLNGHPVAVLQYDFWQTQYQGRPGMVGETIRLNGAPFTVVGIAPPNFEGTDVGFPTKLWLPVAMQPTITPTTPGLDDERSAWFYPFARLKPGVSIAQAEAAMKVLYRQRQHEELKQSFFSRYPEGRDLFLRQTFTLEPAARGNSGLRSRFERPLIVLEWLAGAVLLIACANIAGLLLARGAARQRDLAIRTAIGAGRGRIIGQLFAESAILALGGAIAGLFLGSWLTRLLILSLPYDPGNLSLSATPDLRVLGFTAAVTAVTAVLFGLVPAWQNSRVAGAATLREEAGAIAGGRMHVRLRKFFVALQVALSAVLLLGAGFFIRTLVNLRHVDLGLRSENVVCFHVRPSVLYDDARKIHVFRSLIEGLATVPGVRAVGANRESLFTGGRWDDSLTIPGASSKIGHSPLSFFNGVTPGYFEALGIPVRAGRDFTWRDWGSGRRLALVNEALTGAYFEGKPAVGRMIGMGTRAPADIEIVGVFGNSRYHDVRGEVPRQTFLNLDSVIAMVGGVNVYARAAGDPRQVMPALRAQVSRIDPNLVVSGMRTLDAQINFRMANERLLSFLSVGFAILATVLAIVGLHGVLAFLVAKRTREIGIRMALGARRGAIVRLVAKEMALVIPGGLAVGVAAGYACGRYIESQLVGVATDDPFVFGVAAGALLAAAVAATLIPAVRASRIDPMRALRYD